MKKIKAIEKRLRGLWGDIRPGALQIEVTNACNFHCKMCPFHGPEKASDRAIGFMDIDDYRRVVSQFRDFGGSLVIPQGAGESLLHSDFLEMLSFTKNEMKLAVGFNTNGSKMTDEAIRFVIDTGIDELGFSVDALHSDTFRTITGGELGPVETAVEMLAEKKRLKGVKTPRLRVLLVAQEENLAEIDAYVARWLPVVDEVVIQARRIQAGRVLETPRRERRRPCRHLFDAAFVQWDGELVICCEDWESVTGVGNVFRQSLRELWRGETMHEYRLAQRAREFTPPEICRDCQAWAGGGVRIVEHETAIEIVTALTRTWRRKESA